MVITTKGSALCLFVAMFATVHIGGGVRAQEGDAKDCKVKSTSRENDDPSDWAVQNQEHAIATAREIIGVSDEDAPHVTARVVTLAEDNTPFLHDSLIGRPIWKVVITKWRLHLRSVAPGETDSYERTFDIWVDPENGNLLKIVSRWPKGVPRIAPQPAAEFAEEQMENAGLERYHSFPRTKPSISFLEALDIVFKDGGLGSPLAAKQISAHYVVRSAMGAEPTPVWAITLWGIPPFKAAYPGVPVDARNHARHIVDAKTGKWLCAGTSPQPEG